MVMIAKILSSADFLSKEVRVSLDNSTRIKNWCGGLASILTVLLGIGFGVIFGWEIISKNNPITSAVDQMFDESAVDMREYPIGFSFVDYNSRDLATVPEFMQGIYMQVSLIVIPDLTKPNPAVRYIRYQVVECTSEIMKPEYYTELKALSGNRTMFCIDLRQGVLAGTGEPVSDIPFVRNEYAESDSSFLNLEIRRCYKDNKPCTAFKPPGESFLIRMYTIYSYLNIKDNEKPVKSIATTKAVPITYSLTKMKIFDIQTGTLISDNGWLFEDNLEKTWLYSGQMTEFVDIHTAANGILHSFAYTSPRLRKVYYRRYLKIQELLAQLGGFLKFFMLLARFACIPVSNFVFLNKMKEQLNSVKKPNKRNANSNNYLANNSIQVIKANEQKNLRNISLLEYLKKTIFNLNKKPFESLEKYKELGFIAQKFIELEEKIENIHLDKPKSRPS